MHESMPHNRRRLDQAGFALILALLALLLMTFLGLTMAATPSTELQIATNYRWGQQASYVAQAALDVARKQLREQTTWQIFLPVARAAGQMNNPPQWTPPVPAVRDFENRACDTGALGGNQGYGVVLWPAGFAAPYQNVSSIPGLVGVSSETLRGSYTIWIRRPVVAQADGTVVDSTSNDTAIITAEGTSPFENQAGPVSDYQYRRRATRVFEIQITKVDQNDCEDFGGQTGSSPTGSGYNPCYGVSGAGLPGSPREVNPNQT